MYEAAQQRMPRVQLQHHLGLLILPVHYAHRALHFTPGRAPRVHQTHRRTGQTVSIAHVGNPRAQLALELYNQPRKVAPGERLLHRRIFRLGCRRKFHVSRRHINKLVPVKLAHVGHQERINGLNQQQHLIAVALEIIKVRAACRRAQIIRKQIVNLLALILDPQHILRKRCHRVIQRTPEAQQLHQVARRFRVRGRTLFQEDAKFIPEAQILVPIIHSQLLKLIHNLAAKHPADLPQQRARLHILARHIQRQVLAIHNALQEAQVFRHQRPAILLNQNFARMQADAAFVARRK